LSSSFGGGDGAFFGKGNDLDTVLSKATIVLGTAFGVITLALAKLNA
jgi:preprotein translocase subunit SecG